MPDLRILRRHARASASCSSCSLGPGLRAHARRTCRPTCSGAARLGDSRQIALGASARTRLLDPMFAAHRPRRPDGFTGSGTADRDAAQARTRRSRTTRGGPSSGSSWSGSCRSASAFGALVLVFVGGGVEPEHGSCAPWSPSPCGYLAPAAWLDRRVGERQAAHRAAAARRDRPADRQRRGRPRLRRRHGPLGRGSAGPMADELNRVLQDLQVGVPRQEALERMVERTDVADLRQFVVSVRQSTKHGLPIARILKVQSQELREKRRARVEEKAASLPVKIVFPLVFCILPALFVVILGPSGARHRRRLLNGVQAGRSSRPRPVVASRRADRPRHLGMSRSRVRHGAHHRRLRRSPPRPPRGHRPGQGHRRPTGAWRRPSSPSTATRRRWSGPSRRRSCCATSTRSSSCSSPPASTSPSWSSPSTRPGRRDRRGLRADRAGRLPAGPIGHRRGRLPLRQGAGAATSRCCIASVPTTASTCSAWSWWAPTERRPPDADRVSSTAIRIALAARRHRVGRRRCSAGTTRSGAWWPTATPAAVSSGSPPPTCRCPGSILLPADGIYAGWFDRPDGSVLPTAISLGRRPTFYETADASLLEAHVLDFSGDLYDEAVAVRFVERLRGEERFDTVDALIEQMRPGLRRRPHRPGRRISRLPSDPDRRNVRASPAILVPWVERMRTSCPTMPSSSRSPPTPS